MNKFVAKTTALSLAASLALAPAPSEAIAPILLIFVKQIAQDAAKSILKDMILSSLRDMGCKGIALANAFEAFDLRRSAGGVGGMMGMLGGGMPKMPPGMTMPAMPSGMGIPGMPGGMAGLPGGMAGLPGGMAMPQLPGGMGLPPGLAGAAGMAGLAGMAGMPGMPGMAGMPGMPPEMAAKMREMMPGAGQMPAGSEIDSEQMARMMQAMSRPLSPPETLATIDELAEVGFLPKAVQSELKECMLFLPAAIPAMGMGMAMMKPILPQLRQARDDIRALSPAEQDELAQALLQELRPLPADERKTMLEFLDGGFFPKRIGDTVKLGLKGA